MIDCCQKYRGVGVEREREREMSWTPEISRTIKCVVVGDSNVGKTSLLSRYCRGDFPVDHVPTFFDDDTGQQPVHSLPPPPPPPPLFITHPQRCKQINELLQY